MYSSSFVRLVEDEYMSVLRETTALKNTHGFKTGDKPEYICSEVQRFRDWLTVAIRTVENSLDEGEVLPEDLLIQAASSVTFDSSHEPLHPKLRGALELFGRKDFEAIFGSTRRELFESRTGINVTVCRFRICYDHCNLIKKLSIENPFLE